MEYTIRVIALDQIQRFVFALLFKVHTKEKGKGVCLYKHHTIRYMEIWVAIIGFFKEIIVAIIGLINREKSDSFSKVLKTDASEERKNPFIPSSEDIENIDIKDPEYTTLIAMYLAADRSQEDIKVIDKGGGE